MKSLAPVLSAGLLAAVMVPCSLPGSVARAQSLTIQGQVTTNTDQVIPGNLRSAPDGSIQVVGPSGQAAGAPAQAVTGQAMPASAEQLLRNQALITGQQILPVVPPIFGNPPEVQTLIDRRGTVFPPLPGS